MLSSYWSWNGYDLDGSKTATTGAAVTPAVRLSPNARNLVFESWGGRNTRIENAHATLCPKPSDAVHPPAVVPTGKDVPDTGEHEAVTGSRPPDVRAGGLGDAGAHSADGLNGYVNWTRKREDSHFLGRQRRGRRRQRRGLLARTPQQRGQHHSTPTSQLTH
jgi:hypothetical protein